MLDVEVGLGLEDFAHLHAVLLLVALRARRPDGGAARGIEQAELDADGVGDFAHDAAEGVDFAHEMALGDAANGGVAGHLRDEVEVEREESGAQAHARGGHGGFAASVSGAYDDYVVLFGEGHCSYFSFSVFRAGRVDFQGIGVCRPDALLFQDRPVRSGLRGSQEAMLLKALVNVGSRDRRRRVDAHGDLVVVG